MKNAPVLFKMAVWVVQTNRKNKILQAEIRKIMVEKNNAVESWEYYAKQCYGQAKELESLCTQLTESQQREKAEVEDITSLAKGEYAICDMCKLCGKTKDDTPCPFGAYFNHETAESSSLITYPDEPCNDFKYMRGPQEDGKGTAE